MGVNPISSNMAGKPAMLLSARGLVKSYGKDRAVDGIDLDIPERGFITLLGPSGCGKTTILRMIAGFESPDEGTLTLDGNPLAGVPPEQRPVNTVFQSYALFPHLTVDQNVGFSLTLRKRMVDVETRVRRALEAVHMTEYGDRYPHQLSGGQQQRVAVARATVGEPYLLLLDEPLSALDRKMREFLQIELKDLQRRLGIAFVFVTHDQEEAFALSDTVVVMNKGKIVQQADPHTIYSRPATTFVGDFIGSATIVPGTIRGTDGEAGTAAIETALGLFNCPSVDGLDTGQQAAVAVRPEYLSLSETEGAIRATVTHTVFKGDRYLIETEAQGIRLLFTATAPFEPGQSVGLALDQSRAFVTRVA